MNTDAFDFSMIDLLHERLCLDFVNTTPHHMNLSEDHLRTYADLVSWGHYMGVVDDTGASHLLHIAARQPAEAQAALRTAIDIREALYRILSETAHGESPADEAMDMFNAALAEAMAHLRIVAGENQFGWGWFGTEDSLNRILWAVLWSAAELLTSDDRRFLRECDGHGCDWLFLDTSRNHSRRWCDMKTCGNREKAKRHYARARTSG